MEAAPPSYEKATLIDPWSIVARYIPSNDLCAAALVCSRWHAIFIPHLWGNPASHFGIENDDVYVALTKFKRTLQIARPLVRSQTHTLHLPPAHAELYNGPHATWLRDILDRLPNLQSLIVRGLPFFDYSALQALKYKRPSFSAGNGVLNGAFELAGSEGFAFQTSPDFVPSFGMRLLDASRCPNITAASLAEALRRFEALIYLDLSFTQPARDPVVLRALRRFSGLQIAKFRGIGLNDELLGVLAKAIGRRVRSLDLRDNVISDRGVRTLLDECFVVTGVDGESLSDGQRSPALLSYLGHEMLDIYQGEDFEAFIRNSFTSRFVGKLAIEDTPEGGITHLYVADNLISVEGISGLIRSGRLHVLDSQHLTSRIRNQMRHTSIDDSNTDLIMPGAEKLTPIIAQHATDGLKYLRIDHAIITRDAPSLQGEELVQGRAELADTALPDLPRDAVEIDGSSVQPEVFEMPAITTPRFELAGDPMLFVVTSADDVEERIMPDPEPPIGGPRRGSAFAPEVLAQVSLPDPPFDPIRSPVSALDENGTFQGFFGSTPVSPDSSGFPTLLPEPNVRPPQRTRTYSGVAYERKARLNAHVANKHNLHPAMLPHLSTLVLTDVPPTSYDRDVADRLICFIRQCADEERLAHQQARLDYSLPPGRTGHATALKYASEKIFALKKIVLELAPPEVDENKMGSQWQNPNTRSVTEDRDSESLWSAAETDFSFFGMEDEAYPSLETGRYSNTFGTSPQSPRFGSYMMQAARQSPPPVPFQPQYDTIALLSAFRKERLAAHQRKVGGAEYETEGYWPGAIQITRPTQAGKWEERADYHSTRFERGLIHR